MHTWEKRPDTGALWRSSRAFLSSEMSSAYLQGVLCEVARNADDTLTRADLEAFWIPGLAALGVCAEFHALPEEDRALQILLRERLRHGIPVPLYAFETEVLEETIEEATVEERTIQRVGLVLSQETKSGLITLEEAHGRQTETHISTFRQTYTMLVCLRRARMRGARRTNRLAALLRWVAFSAAYPRRILRPTTQDASLRSMAATYLQEIAGRQGTPFARRLRRAGAQFAIADSERDIDAALRLLQEAVFLEMQLPTIVQRALLTPQTTALTPMERHEMVYLARAGTREMRTLAAHRLTSECQYSDVRRTLEQLARSPDAWVRASVIAGLQGSR